MTSDDENYERCEHCQVGDSYGTYNYYGVEAWLCAYCVGELNSNGEMDSKGEINV